jgi:DNA-binding MarR family transcriptional regulator
VRYKFASNEGSDRDPHLVSRDSFTQLALVIMAKTNRSVSSSTSRDARDLRALLHVPQHDLQSQLSTRLERLGYPSLRPAQVQIMSAVGAFGADTANLGVRLSDLVAEVSLPKQTVGDLLDELEEIRMVERFPDPDHGVIKRVRLGPKGKTWAQEVRKVSAATEAKWATRLGSKKMRSLRALLEELAATVEERPSKTVNGSKQKRGS